MENKTRKPSNGRKRPKPVLARAKVRATMQSLIYQELRRSLMAGVFMPGAKVTLRSVTRGKRSTGTSRRMARYVRTV
jgi:DNA-binding GntR family transcriptional regulator